MKKIVITAVIILQLFFTATIWAADETKTPAKCHITLSLKGWSAFYKTAEGNGRVTCSNGQHADVKINVTGGGLSFGKMDILNAKGTFSDVQNIDEIFGGYIAAEAHAGAEKSAQASVFTKGGVSLALSGTGKGVNIGFDFGRLEISRRTR